MFSDDDEQKCACCQQPFETRATVHAMACGHVLHVECIGEYCDHSNETPSSVSCPACKALRSMKNEVEEKTATAVDEDTPSPGPEEEEETEAERQKIGRAHV